MRKPATKAEKEHMALVKTLPCVVCFLDLYDVMIEHKKYNPLQGYSNSEYDHLVDGYRLGHMYGLPLCTNHHLAKKRYKKGWEWDSSKPNQWRLLEKVYRVLGREIPPYNPKSRNNFKSEE